MDTKLTLSFDKDVVAKAKKFAEANNISLSRLVEFLLTQITAKQYPSLDHFPIADWVSIVSEGEVEYKTKKRSLKSTKEVFFNSKKK